MSMRCVLLAMVVLAAGCKNSKTAVTAGVGVEHRAGEPGEATPDERALVEAYLGLDESWYIHDVFRIEWSDGTSSVFAQHLKRTSPMATSPVAYDKNAVLRCKTKLEPCAGCEGCSDCDAPYYECLRTTYGDRDVYLFKVFGLTCGVFELVRFDGLGTAAPEIRRQLLNEHHCVDHYGDSRPAIGDVDGDGGPEIAFDLEGHSEPRGANRDVSTRTSLIIVDANTLNVQLRYDAIHPTRHPLFGILGRDRYRLQPREDGSPNLGIQIRGSANAPCRGAQPGLVDGLDVDCTREEPEYDFTYDAARDVWEGGLTIPTGLEAPK